MEDKEKFNNPMKGAKIQNGIFIMVFQTVHCLHYTTELNCTTNNTTLQGCYLPY